MSSLETLQYESELLDLDVRSGGLAEWYRENPEQLKKKIDELNGFKCRVAMSNIKDCYKESMIKSADNSLNLLGYKPMQRGERDDKDANQSEKKGSSILSYILPIGMMALLILDSILPKKCEEKNDISEDAHRVDENYEVLIKKFLSEVEGSESCGKG